MNNRLNPTMVQLQMSNLLLQYPELEEDEQLRSDMIEGETEAHEFLSQVERKRQEARSHAIAIQSNIAELQQRQARMERREEAMRALMFKVMEHANLPKIELPEATLSIRAGTPKVLITDEDTIPNAWCRFKREPNKQKIKEALSNGGTIPGAELSNAESVLAIRTK